MAYTHTEGSVHTVYQDAETRRSLAYHQLKKASELKSELESLRLNWSANISRIKDIEIELGMILYELDDSHEDAACVRNKTPFSTVDFVETPIHSAHSRELSSEIDLLLRNLPSNARSILNTPGIEKVASKILKANFNSFRLQSLTLDEFLGFTEPEIKVYVELREYTQEDIERFYRLLKVSEVAKDVNSLLEL